ncbi:MAG: PAS domain-containing protein [Bacteroidota bacterium]
MEFSKKQYLSPIQSLDFYLMNYHKLLKKLKLKNDLEQLSGVLKREVSEEVQRILEQSRYEALVVTDSNRKIIWTDNGFHEMTGYTKRFAVGKKPVFLQGPKTDAETKSKIRSLLAREERFDAAILNYRKNGEEYICHIDVIPLKDDSKKVTHFLAMEKEQKVA